ncbi:hypothetical protein ACO2Q7_16390 [Rathayibacter sp. KR2-224]|uniref:hypothetical protein n=1 Tax=Rathayibacter sp. KR2-224 TaxID=3400913 RepID=UPI003BFBB97D
MVSRNPTATCLTVVRSAVRHNSLVPPRLLWPAFAVVAVLAAGLIPLAFNHGYYFIDDTQAGAIGQWYKIGTRVLSGDWSLINPTVWQSGNYLSEGAWGLFSPILWVVGVGSHAFDNALVYATIVKLICLCVGSFGGYVLGRTFGITRPFAAVLGVVLPLAGVTLYLDATSWVNGLMAWSLWPLAWALSRRAAFGGKSPLLAICSVMAVIGIGYVHATIFLGIALIAIFVEAVLSGHRPTWIRTIGLLAVAVSFGLIVHLPSLLTAPSSGRVQSVVNTGLLTTNLSSLAASSSPVGATSVNVFGNLFPHAPLIYVSWLLPAFAFVAWKPLLRLLRARASVVILFGAALIGVLLPSDVGPLRIPIRMMPYLVIAVGVMLTLGLSRARASMSRTRFTIALTVAAASSWLTFSFAPEFLAPIVVCFVALAGGLWLLYLGALSESTGRMRFFESIRHGRWPAFAAAVAIVGTVGLVIPQHATHPRGPLLDYQIPHDYSQYRSVLRQAVGDVIVVGGPLNGVIRTSDWSETLVANLWYVPEARVQNAYTTVFYPGYGDAMCMQYQGATCPELYTKLFEKQSESGNTLADDIAVSSVQVVKSVVPESVWSRVPIGWHVVHDDSITRLIVRNHPVRPAGGIVWTSNGVTVRATHEDAMGIDFKVEKVPSGGGKVALSRIAWPGYQVDGAAISSRRTDGFLMTLDVPESSSGSTVHVAFVSPGAGIEVAALILIALVTLAWILGRARFWGRTEGSESLLSRASAPLRDPGISYD